MNHLPPISNESLWKLAATVYRAAANPVERPIDGPVAAAIIAACGESDPQRWVAALQELVPSRSDLRTIGCQAIDRDGSSKQRERFRIAADDASADSRGADGSSDERDGEVLFLADTIAACETLLDAVQRLSDRQRSADRFATAVQDGVNRAMYNFAYGLSHELNNPLANISARAEQFARRAADESTRKSAATIVQQCSRAHEMLAEMMLAVRPAAIRTARIDLRDLAEAAADDFAAQAAGFHLGFEARIDPRCLPAIGDADALRHAWQAVFDNAVSASEPGQTVQLVCGRCDTPSHDSCSPQIRWALIDNGRGMTADQIERAFDMYYCGREAGRSLGVGLSKVRRIAELHGGRVWIESLPQVGTAVEMRLPWNSQH